MGNSTAAGDQEAGDQLGSTGGACGISAGLRWPSCSRSAQDEPVGSAVEGGGLLEVGLPGDVEVKEDALDWANWDLLRSSSRRH